MSSLSKLSVSPHIHGTRSTSGIMRDVLISLLPVTVAGTIIFGLRSLLVLAVCVVSCVGFEALYNVITKREQTIGDFSAMVTGLLLGLNLPANIPLWQCVIGSLFAIIVVKCLFGGLGCNLVNPAITARVFMIVAFGAMTVSAPPVNPSVDVVAGATPLASEDNSHIILDLFIGNYSGTIGETCSVALFIGFAYLLIRRVITWQLPVAFIGTVYVFSFFMEEFSFISAFELVLSGGLLLGAIFMATDYVTSPPTAWGKIIFGIGAGLITCLIRYFGSFPEGVSFAILFMNILTPYISGWTQHKVFGVGGKKQ